MSKAKCFLVRNVSCDYYLESVNEFSFLKYGRVAQNKNEKPPTVTVMRIFGITETGTKCCVHIHGFLPYIIFRTRKRLTLVLKAYFVQMIAEIISQTPFAKSMTNIENDALFGIFDEPGMSMYGFHEKNEYFVRVVFRDPRIVRLCVYAFQKQCTTSPASSFLQPFNAHIPVILQFFIDFAIHGMDFVRLSTRYQRINSNQNNVDQIHFDRHLKKSPLRPISNMALELDVFTDDIINPYLAIKSNYKIQGLEFIWEEERRRCELLGLEMQALTPGCIGIPEVRTKREDALRNELKQTLKLIESKCRNLSKNESVNFNSTLSATQQHLSQKLSQEVIKDIQIQCLEDDLEPNNVQSAELNSNKNTVNATILHKFRQNTLNRFGGLKSTRNNSRIWEDRDDNEDEVSGDSDVEELNLQNFSNGKNVLRRANSARDEIYFLDDEDESNLDDGLYANDEIFHRDSHYPSFQKSTNDNNQVGIKTKSYRFVEPKTSAPILLCSPDNQKQSSFSAADESMFGLRSTPSCQDEITNETWNVGDTLSNTLSPIELPTSAEPPKTTESQEAYERLICKVKSQVDYLSVLSVEVLVVSSQPDVRPVADKNFDFIYGIFYAINLDVCNYKIEARNVGQSQFYGRIALSTLNDLQRPLSSSSGEFGVELPPIFVFHELQLFAELTNIVQRYNPDILIGYDTTRFSWGYLYERAEFLNLPFLQNISRIKDSRSNSRLNFRRECSRPPHGRIQLEVWQVVRKECTSLRNYRFSSVVKTVLKRNFPDLQPDAIHEVLKERVKTCGVFGIKETIMRYFTRKCSLNIELLDALNFFTKTSQMAHVYGIQFVEVLSRGSQFRVESILLRLAMRQKFMAPSVSEVQRNLMGSPETIPLNLEPESGIYYDPVVVLDFQSLYPSICIAYNYCFSTCLGKLAHIKNLSSAFTSMPLPQMTLGALENYEMYDAKKFLEFLETNALNISPTGGIFLKAHKRKSLLAQMLQELLDARIMVKKAMQQHARCESLNRVLDARQLALKLVANVTYGYTAANWSGRMPCDVLADAIVSKGREALECAIQTIHENSSNSKIENAAKVQSGIKYGSARVIYGDTDSLFVLFQGHSKAEAFCLGEKIAADISAANPYPMKLKFEKVMQPCVLITKKRYVGMSYEYSEQKVGKFDAKGIETVRRDACEFVAKIMENVLRLLFDVRPPVPDAGEISGKVNTGGLDAALYYLKYRLMNVRKISPTEFVLSNEYKEHYAATSVFPVKRIAEELTVISPRLTPLRGERVCYIIALGTTTEQKRALHFTGIFGSSAPASGLTGTVTSHAVTIDKFLTDPNLDIHYDYYVTNQLFPALMRFFQLIGVRLRWRNGEALRNYCIGCTAPNAYPWCAKCAKIATPLVVRRSIQTRQFATIRRTCHSCLDSAKSLGNVEDLLTFQRCANFACYNRQAIMLAERGLLQREFKSHISSFSLNYLNYF